MMLLQISSAQGPDECALAVAKALERLAFEAEIAGVKLDAMEMEKGRIAGIFPSAMVSLEGNEAEALAERWIGSVRWICASPYRPHHGRKNWFIGVARVPLPKEVPDSDIRFEATRSSGPGGQHVNKTDSAIRATHIATGISVKVQSERSQHANKRLARLLIAHRLEEQRKALDAGSRAQRRMLHYKIERGNPVRVFKGPDFNPA